jgi:acyl carrier protein
MNRSDIVDRIAVVTSTHLNRPVEKITEESAFIANLGADSLDTVEIIMAVEELFDVGIEDDEVDSIETVGQLADLVAKKLGVAG